jgi:hypothetical protein
MGGFLISCYSDESKSIRRPGQGEPLEKCGEKLMLVCLECNTYFYGTHSCMSRECPNCYEGWAWSQAFPAQEKLLFNRNGNKIIHAVISIPGEPHEIFEKRNQVYRWAKSHNISGGCCIPHFERHGQIDGYLHYHLVAYIRTRYEPGDADRRYLFKCIRFINKVHEIAPVIKYLLTHCAISDYSNSITYFGMKFRKVDRIPPRYFNDICPGCGSRNCHVAPVIDYTGGFKLAQVVEIDHG